MRRQVSFRTRVWQVHQVLVLAVGWPAAAMAQPAADRLPAGARVRLHFETRAGDAARADVVRAGADTLWVRYAGAADTTAVARASLRALDVYRGPGRRQVGRGARIGLLVGAAAGGALGAGLAATDPEDAEFFGGALGATAFFAGLGAVPGVVIGALAGISRREVWERLPLR